MTNTPDIKSFPAEIGAITLLQIFSEAKDGIRIQSLSGSVDIKFIDRVGYDFTYEGLFGRRVLSLVIKHNCIQDIGKKMIVLAACMHSYSRTLGGFTITNI